MKDASVLVPGLHTLTARAIDRMGNQAETGARLILPIKLPQNGDTCNLCLTLYDKI